MCLCVRLRISSDYSSQTPPFGRADRGAIFQGRGAATVREQPGADLRAGQNGFRRQRRTADLGCNDPRLNDHLQRALYVRRVAPGARCSPATYVGAVSGLQQGRPPLPATRAAAAGAVVCLRERHQDLEDWREMTLAEMFTRLAKHYDEGAAPPFDFAVVDEAQDISQAELRCLTALGGGRRNALFFAGDTAQRIFQQLFSLEGSRRRGEGSLYKPEG